jgi:cytochrome P450/protein-S-isoprenylcysteine O-methyltransferase Ste14
MLSAPWPPAVLFLLRHALFLGPLCAVGLLMARRRDQPRVVVGALFALLYGLPTLFIAHVAAIQLGLWRYGGAALKMLEFPADIWFAGALLGPALYLAGPGWSPWLLAAALIGLDGFALPALSPFVTTGPHWFAGVVAIVLAVHLPALLLARWTGRDEHLPRRAFLLAIGFGGAAFFLVPTVIMQAMGGDWSALALRPGWALAAAGLGLAGIAVIGLSGVQMFVLYGEGTPIPLDPTRRLVREGVYAYVCNPMQLSTALAFAALGAVLGNVWVSLAAAMAVVFVLGMVRWHHRNDLAVRFPAGWPEYRAHVGEWLPRWRPWVAEPARLSFDPVSRRQRAAVGLLRLLAPTGLAIEARPGPLGYADRRGFEGPAAFAQALSHCNFIAALIGAAALLVLLPLGAAFAARGPRSLVLGLDSLWRLRRPLDYYGALHRRHGDVVRLRIGPYRIWLLFHPAAIEAALTTHADSFVRFEPVMRVLRQWNGQSLLTSEGARWRARRRQALPAFARSRMAGYGARIVAHASAMAAEWDAAAPSGLITLDTDRAMADLALRIAADALFGDQTVRGLGEFGDAMAVLSEVAFRESTAPWRPPAWWPADSNRRKQAAIASLDRLVRAIVEARMADRGDDRGDLLSMLIEHAGGDSDSVREEATTLLIAGHETTGAALAWASDLLSRNPQALARAQEEIDREIGDRAAAAADLARLGFLRAVVDETLRLYPPAYALFPRRATRRVAFEGIEVAAGDLVQIVPFVTQRDVRWFDEPGAFRPERFLAPSAAPPWAYLPFGGGPRVCIGQYFGLLELTLALATVLQRWTPTAPDHIAEPEARFSLRPRGGLKQQWRRRRGG